MFLLIIQNYWQIVRILLNPFSFIPFEIFILKYIMLIFLTLLITENQILRGDNYKICKK
jgi:hypothetical protein